MIRLHTLFERHWPLLLVLGLGLALRLMLWDNLPRVGMISDEAEYLAAADWLAHGRGFAWHHGWLWTRAPLYVVFLAAHMRLFGFNFAPIYVSQIFLSLVNIALVYVLARQIMPARDRWATPLAALLAALYLPFGLYAQMILSETVYLTLLLAAFVALGVWMGDHDRWRLDHRLLLLALAGGLLGLATLTRGLTLGFLPLVGLWVWWVGRRMHRSDEMRSAHGRPLVYALVFGLCALLVMLPWSVYASRLYGGTILVDTTGAYNLLLGTRTAYDGGRRDAPVRNFVLALLDPQLTPEERQVLLADACLYQRNDPGLQAALAQPVTQLTQGDRQQLMVAEGLCLLRAAPGAFVAKSLREMVDLFQINYSGAERLTDGFALGRLPRWYVTLLFLLDDTLYVLVLPLAVLGWGSLRRVESRKWKVEEGLLAVLIGLWWLYNMITAPLLFAINRFRLPLLPFAFVCAAYLLLQWRSVYAGKYAFSLISVLAGVLALFAIAPYAYLQHPPSDWASYLGPYPSSLVSTGIAWQTRPDFGSTQALQRALGDGDAAMARSVLETGAVPDYTQALAWPLLAALEGRPADGLDVLDQSPVRPLAAWQTTVVRGDLLRHMGDWQAARVVLSPTEIDDQNPVEWAWHWLYPPPLPDNRLDLGGDLDLGYIRGFYLGEGDPAAEGTFRWSGPQAYLRFPQAASGNAQQLCLRADGRGWYTDLPMPQIQFALEGQVFARIRLERAVQEYCVPLPVRPPHTDLVVMLQSESFVPDAADLLGQQGPQVGQLRQLGVRLDWAEVRR